MNIKEILENYNVYTTRISIIENEIFKIEQDIIDIKGINLDGMPKQKGFITSSLENKIANKIDKIKEREEEKKQLEQVISIIDNLIKTLKKFNQDVIKMRFIDKMSYEEIADKKSRTTDLINKVLSSSINKMQNTYNKYS